MGLYKDRGVVVSGFRLGEADKVLTILTEGRGTLRAVAKGVRKTQSRFGGRLEPLSHVALMVHEGRSLDVITQADTMAAYPAVRSRPDRLSTAFALAEAAMRVAHEHEPAPRLYRLLTAGLAGLDNLPPRERVPPLYFTVFLLRLMDVAGLSFSVGGCASCGSPDVSDRAGVAEGGALCRRCAGPGSFHIHPRTLALIASLSTGRVAESAVAAGEPPETSEASALVRRFAEHHLEVRLKAPRFQLNFP